MMIVLNEAQEKFIFFLYGEDKLVPVKFVRCRHYSKENALAGVGKNLFGTLDGIKCAKVKKLYDLGVEQIILTDAATGRIVYKADILDYLRKYGSNKVYSAWADDFSEYDTNSMIGDNA